MKYTERMTIGTFLLCFIVLVKVSAQSVCQSDAVCGVNLDTPCIDDPTTPECVSSYFCYNVAVVDLNFCCETNNTDQCPHGGEDLTIPDCTTEDCTEAGHVCTEPDNVCCPEPVCPKPTPAADGLCNDLCDANSCNQGLLCCPTDCGHECKSPVAQSTGDVLPPRWWLPSCYREKVNAFKTYISRLVDVLSVCKFCFSIEIGKRMAGLADCLRQDAPFSVLTQLTVTLEYVADDDTAQIAAAIREAADGIAETATIEICPSTDPSEITALVDQLDFYADGIEQGYFNCIVPKICRCHGDPHCKTFDGKKYTYSPIGNYTLLKQDHFTVVAEFDHCSHRTNRGSCVKSIEITSTSHGFTILLDREGKVYVNGREESPSYIFMSSGGEINIDNYPDPDKMVVELVGGVEVTWDESKDVEIFVSPGLVTEGMCGNNNNDKTDEYTGPDGTVYNNKNDFRESWKVPTQP